jgi:branched-chain amino acid transport system permease protein
MCLIVFSIAFKWSSVGIRMRAAADNQRAALSLGIDVNRMFALSWMIAALLAAVGAMIIGQMNVLSIELSYIGLTVFPVVILGGLDSVGGAVLGGLVIGIIENLAGGYLGAYIPGAVKFIVPYIVLLLILLLKPYGFFGTHEIERV